ncbi:MASE2 domain-containing protein [uncultured Xylophilus sp.]|uniref:MASE2 domain-containing protein n=1 Tax=uncultured Xylophilus sp. TaxID=296832 RepID=UPI0034560C84
MTTSYPLDRRKRAGHLPRQIYLPRTLGFGLGCLGMAVALGEHGTPRWVWYVFIFGAYVWLHIAFQICLRSERLGRTEGRKNFCADSR